MLEELDAQVRAVLRREGIDPQRDEARLRAVVAESVRAHDERSLTGAVVPVADAEATARELVARIGGFGALQPYLDDPEVEEIWINAPDRVFVARAGRHALTTTILTAAEVRELVERMLKQSGRRLDVSTPFVDARLPQGHRLHVVLEGVSAGFAAVNIRKFLHRSSRLADLVALGSLSPQAADFLTAGVAAGLSVLVAGATQAGKTTLLNCLAGAVPGHERIVSVEEVRELSLVSAARALFACTVAIAGRPELRATSRSRASAPRTSPTSNLVGRIRSDSRTRSRKVTSPLPSNPACRHSSATQSGCGTQLCTLPMLAGENISARFVVPTVAASLDLVVHLGVDRAGVRRVNEIAGISGRVEEDVIELEPLFVRDADGLRRTGGMPTRLEAFERAGIDVAALLHPGHERQESSWARS